ncbi:MAG: phosphatidylglycerophosphatase A [Gammaproteobacteria bacterium]
MNVIFDWVIRVIASMGGIGYVKFAPGTLASLATLILVYVFNPFSNGFWLILFPALMFSWAICAFAEKIFEGHDNSRIVIDEFAGLLVCFALIDFDLITMCIGFMLFRVFDIAKPWPISFIDKSIRGGIGILMDDILAGFFSGAIIAGLKILLIT